MQQALVLVRWDVSFACIESNMVTACIVGIPVQVRPLLEHEVVLSCEECVRTVGEDQLVLGDNQTFRFDRVFPPSAPQVFKL